MSLRQNSNASIGFPDIQSESKERNPEIIIESNTPEVRDQLTDVCGVLLICKKHNNIAVSKITTKGLWLPLIGLKPNDSYITTALSLTALVFEPNLVIDVSELQLINIFRVKLPKVNNFITRITFMSTISTALDAKCCKPYKKYEWLGIEKALESDNEFWGPEMRHFIKTYTESDTGHAIQEFDVKDALKYIPREIPQNNEELMLKMTRCSENDIKKLYEEFVIHCFPSQFMTFASFISFANRLEIKAENFEPIFHSFDLHNNGFITFHELLLGLTAMDPDVVQFSPCFPIRCGYLFRYYDSDSDGWLTHTDICALMRDAKVGYSEDSVTELIERIGSNSRVNSDQFIRAVKDMQMKRTSNLFRTQTSILRDIALKYSYERNSTNTTCAVALVKNRSYQKACGQCRNRKYQLSVQAIKILKSGEPISISIESELKSLNIHQYVWDIPMNSLTALAIDLIEKINTIGFILFDRHSTQYQTPPHLESLNNWFHQSKQELLKNLKIICFNAMNIFAKEDRVVRITSPCYVFGDIHGNLNDLLTFSRNIWKNSPFVNESNFLFLGDYVDRGLYGVECVIYLFAFKILAPKAFYLVRGNHEVRPIQRKFSFYKECIDRFDEDLWNQINNAFDRLPVCAVIDDAIYCAHGGIPTSTHTIESLMNIPQPLPDPQNQSPQAWEVLWNDPLSAEDFMSLSNFQRTEIDKTQGFVENIKRGTGYSFSEHALENFLSQNHLSGVIRAHEVVYNGYRFMANGKLISIFSSSLYCGLRNTAAVVLLDREKIRIIRIETF